MKNREILVTRAGVVAAVGLLVAALTRFGLHVDDSTRSVITDWAIFGLPIVLPFGHALWSRLHVTPTFDPKDASGRPLVPVIDADLYGVDPTTLDTTATFPAVAAPATPEVPASPAEPAPAV